MKAKFPHIVNTGTISSLNYKIIVSSILFKFNNIFITVSKFQKYGNTFTFVTVLKSLSCGQFKKKQSTSTKTKKLSLLTLNKLLNKFIIFLVYNENKNIHIIFKNQSNYKKTLLLLFIKFHLLKGINICTIAHILNYPYNGCRLKKRKFK
uniref:Ribosomal protein S11 n=1 Tax=Babesia motasi TaxID=237580 RepID=A0A411ADI6_9APIC|nr:ribosomal protein S11 [Babesia motasi]QAX27126.1 ribosomal protein S11 [Babesia motasi]